MGRKKSSESPTLGRQVEAEHPECERVGEGEPERERQRARQKLADERQAAGSQE
jgi:hypothetical protein